MKRISLLLTMLSALLVLPSCSWSRMRMNNSEKNNFYQQLKQVVPEKTREDDLPALLTAPQQIMPQKSGGQLYVYQVGDTKMKGLMLIVVNFSVSNSVSDTIYIYTDQGIVTKVVSAGYPKKAEWEYWPFGD